MEVPAVFAASTSPSPPKLPPLIDTVAPTSLRLSASATVTLGESTTEAPFSVNDAGPDGVANTADDVSRTFYGIPNALISGCSATTTTVTPTCAYPTNNVIMNAPDNGKYKTVEVSLNKRQSHNYSVGAGFGYTWKHDFPLSFPNTPNGPFDYDYRDVSFKINGTYNAPWGINISPVYRFQGGTNFARTLSGYVDIVVLRTFKHETAEEFAFILWQLGVAN